MKQPYHALCSAAAAAVCAVLFSIFSSTARAASLLPLSTHVPPAVAAYGLKPTGNLPDTNLLSLSIGLPLRDKAGLDILLNQIYDPSSPNYHHYLSVAEFADKFGPTMADYEALRSFAKANHLAETHTFANRMVLSVRASVADINKAFQIHILNYAHPTEGRQFYAPDKEPVLDLAAPVLHIGGLDNYDLPHPRNINLHGTSGKGHPLDGSGTNSPRGGSGPGGGYISSDFRNAYAPGVTLNGSGQSVGLLEYDAYFPSDITTYEEITGLPAEHLINVPIDGGVSTPGGGEPEVSLDIEMVMAMAPGIESIYVYESPGGPPDDLLSAMATNVSTKQFSSSWGFTGDAETDQLYQEMAAQGQSVFFASGDRGGFNGSVLSDGSGPQSFGSPYFICVGGTQLVMNGDGFSYNSESVWGTGEYETNSNWGSSGGICTFYPIPAYQKGINMTVNGGSTTFRNCPDVALTAIGIWQNFGDGDSTPDTGGTSAASPLWAGFNAMINQQGAIYSMPPDGFINPAIYALAKGPNYTKYFHDITVGNNTWPGSPSNYFAGPGYDLCTGWGTPTGSNLINALAPPLTIPVLVVVTNFVTGGNGGGVITYDECANLTFLITNQGIATATGIQGFLYSTTRGAIVGQSTANFPDLPPGTAAESTTPFTLSTEPTFICGTPIDLVLIMKSDQAAQTNSLQLPTGFIGPPISFNNQTPYVVPEGAFTGVSSPVTVSNLQAASKITVSVWATTEYDEGLTLQLISPNGTTVVLTEVPNGDLGANYGSGCFTNSETTFDDNASISIASGVAPFIGSYQPEDPLSAFLPAYGTNLNGVWQLNASELFSDVPATLECWSLNITPYVCQDGGGQCPGSALSLTMSDSPNPVTVYSNLVYTLTVSNAGPSDASAVVISQSLPPGVGFVTTSNYPAQATLNGTNLTLTLGALPVYGTAAVQVVTIPTIPGLATSVATAGATGPSLNANNTASASTLVVLPSADLSVSMTASPASLLQGGLVTYTIVVTNNGPSTATGVMLTNELPADVNYVSSTTSQGSILLPGVQFSLGTLPTGSNAVITVTVSTTTTGNVTDTAQVGLGALEMDPISFNNTASFTVSVGPSADLAVSAVVTPATVVEGNNYTYIATVVNNGPSSASSVVFNQTIPGGTGLNAATFVSSSASGVTVTNANISWNIGNMASGASLVITNVMTSPTIASGGKPIVLSSTFTVFGQPNNAKPNNGTVTITNLVELPTITIVPVNATLVSQSGGPATNGAINPGETVGLQFYLQNTGNVSTTNLQATLQATGGVTFPGGSPQNYGALVPGGSPVGGSFTFLASGTNGGTVVATLSLQDGSTSLGNVSFTFNLPVVQTFWNVNPIYIPFINAPSQSGPGSPYPSTIQVSNVTGFVSKVTVTVSNLSHTYPHDIGLLLVGPSTNTVLMDAVAETFGFMTDTTLTFDSTAPSMLSSNGSFTTGTYQPSDYNPNDVFTNAVASGSTNVLSPPYSTSLDSFIGSPANGTWSLYAHDDKTGDVGTNQNGWGLTITTITPVNPTNSLVVGIVPSASQVTEGGLITYLFSVTNNGVTAVNAYLTNVLPAGLTFSSVSGPLTNYTTSGPTNVYNLGSLSPGAGVTITNVDLAIASGLQTNTIGAGVPFAAFNVGDNSATVTTTVTLPVADLAAAISFLPTTAVLNDNLAYSLAVTNLGPSNSFETFGTFPLKGLQWVSSSTTQGSVVVTNGAVQCSFGTIPVGYIAILTVTAAPTNIGMLTNVWTVTNVANAISTTNVLTVNYPEPIIAAAGVTLISPSGPSANGAINSNETVTVAFTLTNQGYASTTNLVATLQATGGITPITTSQDYGVIPPGSSSSEQYSFIAIGAPGAMVTATLALVDGTNTLGNVSYAFLIPFTTNFASATAISIPEGAPNATEGPASPYPSSIFVSGLTNLLVGKVTLTLNGFAHTFPHDVNILLASPSGTELTVMGHAGGPYSATNLTLTFSDTATQSLPVGQLVSGTYLPTDYAPQDVFPGLSAASEASVLALFNGENPNGSWSLYVYDDTLGNSGLITGGWSLGLTAVSTVNPASLLAASMISSPNPVFSGNYLNYQITVTNQGPATASSVVLTDTLPTNAIFSSASVSQGSVTNTGGTVTCSLGSISNGAIATATIRVIAGAAGTIVNNASVATASTDLYLAASTISSSAIVQPSPSPELRATNLVSGLQLTLLGQEGQNYSIEVSSNLLIWTSVFTNTASLTSGSFIYTDKQTNGPRRFYRAQLVPQ